MQSTYQKTKDPDTRPTGGPSSASDRPDDRGDHGAGARDWSRTSLADQGLAYWDSIRNGRPTPRREDFDPADIPRLLTHVVFLDVIDAGADFRFRVIGDAVRSASFANHTGQCVSDLPHVSPDGPLMQTLRSAVDRGVPVRSPIPYEGPRKEFSVRDHLVMPLADAGGAVSHLLLTVDLVDTRR
ncbi:MAG: PAS domain-containing protein [Thalassobaculaceae bacterium]|nr:PAS domain-containing protein [Thalassobaculaceae bacterium]